MATADSIKDFDSIASQEIWRPLARYPLYEVSDHGRIRSKLRYYTRIHYLSGSVYQVKSGGRIIKGWTKRVKSNYVRVMVALRHNGKTYQERLHRLVLEAFVGPCPRGMEACHNDGNALNNQLSNLRWDTHINNVRDAKRHGSASPPPVHWGEKHHNAKLTFEEVQEIRRTPIMPGTKTELAKRFNTSLFTINRILNGKTRVNG